MLHLQNILPLLKQHRKFILIFTVLINMGTALLLFFIPPEYKSVVTLTPLNTQLADKGTLFNPNIKDLYSIFGNGDDIERMEAANDWNSIYLAMVQELKLDVYYKIKDANLSNRQQKAAAILKTKLYAQPTEKSMLQLIAWSKEPEMSVKLANVFTAKISARIQSVILSRYDSAIKYMQRSHDTLQYKYKKAASELSNATTPEQQLAKIEVSALANLLTDNIKITGELQQAKASVPQILFVLDNPVADKTAVRPDKPAVIIGTFLAALIFSMAWVIIYHRNNQA